MAQFTRVNGDLKPVFWLDEPAYTNSGVNAVTSEATVQPQGPKLEFFTFTAAGALTTTEVAQAVQSIQQLATIYMYEYTDASSDTLAMALYPVGAYTAATLQTQLQALGGGFASGTVAATATFTN